MRDICCHKVHYLNQLGQKEFLNTKLLFKMTQSCMTRLKLVWICIAEKIPTRVFGFNFRSPGFFQRKLFLPFSRIIKRRKKQSRESNYGWNSPKPLCDKKVKYLIGLKYSIVQKPVTFLSYWKKMQSVCISDCTCESIKEPKCQVV